MAAFGDSAARTSAFAPASVILASGKIARFHSTEPGDCTSRSAEANPRISTLMVHLPSARSGNT
jgi:hypothetical protein